MATATDLEYAEQRMTRSPLPRAALIVNPAAGRASDDLEQLKAGLGAHFTLEVLETSAERDGDACAREAVARGAAVVVAAGGDGTVSLVARALIGTDVRLGVIPRGTSNSIAAAFGIPDDLEGAIRTVVEGEARLIDTAVANGRTMLLHASIGFHAATVGHTSRDAKKRWGVLAYVKEGIAELGRLEPFEVELETDSAVVRCRATNLMVSNVAPPKTVLAQGPAVLSPVDGALDVTIVAAVSLADAVVTGLHLFRTAVSGEPATRDNVGFLSAGRVRLKTTPPQPILIDGEDAGEGELVASCRAQSLHLFVPRDVPIEEAHPGERKLTGLPGLAIEPKT